MKVWNHGIANVTWCPRYVMFPVFLLDLWETCPGQVPRGFSRVFSSRRWLGNSVGAERSNPFIRFASAVRCHWRYCSAWKFIKFSWCWRLACLLSYSRSAVSTMYTGMVRHVTTGDMVTTTLAKHLVIWSDRSLVHVSCWGGYDHVNHCDNMSFNVSMNWTSICA